MKKGKKDKDFFYKICIYTGMKAICLYIQAENVTGIVKHDILHHKLLWLESFWNIRILFPVQRIFFQIFS